MGLDLGGWEGWNKIKNGQLGGWGRFRIRSEQWLFVEKEVLKTQDFIYYYYLYDKLLQQISFSMSQIEKITSQIIKFRDERDWEQFHNGKDLALALSIEAAELNQLFLWKKAEDVNIEKVKEELADVLNYSFLLAHKYGFDIEKIILDKIAKNASKYPIEKAKGNAKKYTEL